MQKYFLHNGITDEGPYSLEQLEQKGLNRNHMVWYEGLVTWTKVTEIPELVGLIKETNMPEPIRRDETYLGRPGSNKYIALVLLILIFVLLITWLMFRRS